MEAFFFWIFSILMILAGLSVILNRNPVASALSLVATLVFLSALFFLLHAFFLGAVQILVYAGAVMVLFLFIIMLLDLKAEARRRANWFYLVAAFLTALFFTFVVMSVVSQATGVPVPQGSTDLTAPGFDDVKAIGTLLFTRYLLPFEITSVLLLVATIGVILLSKKETK